MSAGGAQKTSSSLIRNFTFGVEDSLSSSVGLLCGIASAQMSSSAIIATGFILIFIEALSMGIGSFLSDQSANEYQLHHAIASGNSLPGAVIMFISYFGSGFIPLFPYIFFPRAQALNLSIIFSLAALFLLGCINSAISRTPLLKNSLRMLILGGVVVIAGLLAGRLLKL
ncbi:MAG: hypothetical protein UX91_C0006G0122 [Candidatus Amesbacteria bacterium GW2011_GWB1_47_19]|nr:MAG: hypothetical protein UW51_C0002G0123 [Candidatus Amesbacteria bacterium GW2011_GWA1_44_24]KKU31287.1 MAG: hypothetical protein UX46_C0006G0079 [Candidatus Amesbacteria bacterium GW2011_GWC1_46_24]KKU67060.1 MAG: hypothetical protein UX91_C0006G0122 [Candidatus Amesbacteria bacterium GW2011_GWB1_47_19]OGD04949.1 MAG: hypothetical protein A2379_04190 [Candidatus Amesbacteria bacterium RIFOXYB1_FULL_47_13]HBC72721.1 hypothetical protein [Candidatus Amesbacteria bacterium]